MKFDAFLALINDWGPYQKVKFVFICLSYMVPPIMVYTWSFTAATPDFRCHYPSLEQDVYNATLNKLFNTAYEPRADECAHYHNRLSLKECQRCYQRTSELRNNSTMSNLQKCNGYIFDRSVYRTTLVEEVRLKVDERSRYCVLS